MTLGKLDGVWNVAAAIRGQSWKTLQRQYDGVKGERVISGIKQNARHSQHTRPRGAQRKLCPFDDTRRAGILRYRYSARHDPLPKWQTTF